MKFPPGIPAVRRCLVYAEAHAHHYAENGDKKMRIRNAVVEYDLEETAAMLDISPVDLKQAVNAGHLQYYYRLGENDYLFHEASLRANKDLLSQEDYLTKVLSTCSSSEDPTEPDASEEDPPSTPSDP